GTDARPAVRRPGLAPGEDAVPPATWKRRFVRAPRISGPSRCAGRADFRGRAKEWRNVRWAQAEMGQLPAAVLGVIVASVLSWAYDHRRARGAEASGGFHLEKTGNANRHSALAEDQQERDRNGRFRRMGVRRPGRDLSCGDDPGQRDGEWPRPG